MGVASASSDATTSSFTGLDPASSGPYRKTPRGKGSLTRTLTRTMAARRHLREPLPRLPFVRGHEVKTAFKATDDKAASNVTDDKAAFNASDATG